MLMEPERGAEGGCFQPPSTRYPEQGWGGPRTLLAAARGRSRSASLSLPSSSKALQNRRLQRPELLLKPPQQPAVTPPLQGEQLLQQIREGFGRASRPFDCPAL